MEKLRTSIDWRGVMWNYAQLTAGAMLLIITFNLFIAPASMAPGGVSGLAVIINHLAGWPNGLTMLFLNIPSIMLGFSIWAGFDFWCGRCTWYCFTTSPSIYSAPFFRQREFPVI